MNGNKRWNLRLHSRPKRPHWTEKMCNHDYYGDGKEQLIWVAVVTFLLPRIDSFVTSYIVRSLLILTQRENCDLLELLLHILMISETVTSFKLDIDITLQTLIQDYRLVRNVLQMEVCVTITGFHVSPHLRQKQLYFFSSLFNQKEKYPHFQERPGGRSSTNKLFVSLFHSLWNCGMKNMLCKCHLWLWATQSTGESKHGQKQ